MVSAIDCMQSLVSVQNCVPCAPETFCPLDFKHCIPGSMSCVSLIWRYSCFLKTVDGKLHNKKTNIFFFLTLEFHESPEGFSHSQKYKDHNRSQMEDHRCDSHKMSGDKIELPVPDYSNQKPQCLYNPIGWWHCLWHSLVSLLYLSQTWWYMSLKVRVKSSKS